MKKTTLIVALSLLGLVGTPQLVRAGETERAIQRAAEAEVIWQSITSEQPQNAEAYFNLGIALGNQGKWTEAIAAYQTALQIDPQLTAAHINLGRAFTEIQQLEAAERAYRDALRLEPNQRLAQERLNELQRGGNIAVN